MPRYEVQLWEASGLRLICGLEEGTGTQMQAWAGKDVGKAAIQVCKAETLVPFPTDFLAVVGGKDKGTRAVSWLSVAPHLTHM